MEKKVVTAVETKVNMSEVSNVETLMDICTELGVQKKGQVLRKEVEKE